MAPRWVQGVVLALCAWPADAFHAGACRALRQRGKSAWSPWVMSEPQEGSPPASTPPEDYEGAERLGLALFKSGDYEAAITWFEKAKTFPGAGYDVVRISPGSQTPGDKSQPPNPRGLQERR